MRLSLVTMDALSATIGLAPPIGANDRQAVLTHLFSICPTGGSRTDCVVDGDTAWIDGVKVRVADIKASGTPLATLHRAEILNHRLKARRSDARF